MLALLSRFWGELYVEKSTTNPKHLITVTITATSSANDSGGRTRLSGRLNNNYLSFPLFYAKARKFLKNYRNIFSTQSTFH